MKNIIKCIVVVAIAIIVETIVAVLSRGFAPMIVLGVIVFPFYNAMCVRIVIKMLDVKSVLMKNLLILTGMLVQSVEFNVIFENTIFEFIYGIRGRMDLDPGSHQIAFIFFVISIVCYFISYGVSYNIIKDNEAE